MGMWNWGYAGEEGHKCRSPEEDCHGTGAMGICTREAIKVEALRETAREF
jgi:hypothetical protein